MKIKTSQPFLAAIAIPLTLLGGTAGAASLIYEGFNYDTGSVGGGSGGTGFTGNWSTYNTAPVVVSPGMSWGTLAVSGNSVSDGAGGSGARDIGATSVLDSASLTGNGQTLWFSVILGRTGASWGNVDLNFALGTDGFHQYVAGSGGTFGERMNLETGEGIGIALVARSTTTVDIHAAYWQDSGDANTYADRVIDGANSEAINRWAGPTGLFVGRIDWGANDLAGETISIYAPDTNLNLGSALVTWTTAALDQSDFDTVAFQIKNAGANIDEIRFGASSADVLPIPEPSSFALLSLTGLALLRRRR